MSRRRCDTVIVGGGIIGLALGLDLTLRGRQVTLIDRDEPASGCSAGNAGYLSQGGIFPIASFETFRQLPRLLLDQASPLSIRLSHLPRLVPWGMQLLAACKPGKARRAMQALAALTEPSVQSYAPLLKAGGAEDLIDTCGGLHVFKKPRSAETLTALIDTYDRLGISAEHLDGHTLREFEPALSPTLAGALHFPGSARCLDPRELGQRFAENITARGGIILRGAVRAIRPGSDGGWSLATEHGEMEAENTVIAAGRWSDELMRPLGYRVPLEAERGYHLMLPSPDVRLNHPLIATDHQFAITPMAAGIRLAGTVEFAGRRATPNFARADMLLPQAQSILPELQGAGATRWMGHRPSLPDSLPAIGAGSEPGLYYAFGHQHCGLTLAAVTAKLLGDLMSGREPDIDLTPFDITRFGRSRPTRIN